MAKGYKTGGRRPGSRNKIRRETREKIALLVDSNVESLQAWITASWSGTGERQLQAARLLSQLLEYAAPKHGRLNADASAMDEQRGPPPGVVSINFSDGGPGAIESRPSREALQNDARAALPGDLGLLDEPLALPAPQPVEAPRLTVCVPGIAVPFAIEPEVPRPIAEQQPEQQDPRQLAERQRRQERTAELAAWHAEHERRRQLFFQNTGRWPTNLLQVGMSAAPPGPGLTIDVQAEQV